MAAAYKCPCSSCGTNIEFPEEYLGQQASCPSCGNSTLLAIAPVASTPPRPSPPPPPRPAPPAPPSAARPAPTPAQATAAPIASDPDSSVSKRRARPNYVAEAAHWNEEESETAGFKPLDESKWNQGRSWILISAAVLTALAGLFWVGLGVLQGVVPLFAKGQVPWKEIFQNMVIGGLIVGLGVGLFMRIRSCYQWGVATHLVNILWVVYQIFNAQFYLGILAVLLHGAAALATVMSTDEFPSE